MKSHRTSPAFVAAISRLMTCRQFPIGRKLLAIVANSSRISATQVQMRGFTLISSAQIKNRKKENPDDIDQMPRSEEHTSELQSLMSISYAVFCLKKKKKKQPM